MTGCFPMMHKVVLQAGQGNGTEDLPRCVNDCSMMGGDDMFGMRVCGCVCETCTLCVCVLVCTSVSVSIYPYGCMHVCFVCKVGRQGSCNLYFIGMDHNFMLQLPTYLLPILLPPTVRDDLFKR